MRQLECQSCSTDGTRKEGYIKLWNAYDFLIWFKKS